VIAASFLTDFERRLTEQMRRAKAAASGLSVDELNRKHSGRDWSIAQIFDHLMISTAPYLDCMSRAIEGAPRSTVGGEINFSMLGSFIIRAAGPGPNTPAPKKLHPGGGPYGKDIVDKWLAQNEAVLVMARNAQGVELSKVKVKNPVIGLFKMNLADMFELLAVHAERHVAQIEEMAA
jgi:hypothetical protein